MGSVGSSSSGAGSTLTPSVNLDRSDIKLAQAEREEKQIHDIVDKLSSAKYVETNYRNGAGVVTGKNYRINLGDYDLRIQVRKAGKTDSIMGFVSGPSTNPSFTSETIFSNSFKSVDAAKRELKKRLKKHLIG